MDLTNPHIQPQTAIIICLSELTGYTTNWTWTNTLNYTEHWGKNNHIQALVGTRKKGNYNHHTGWEQDLGMPLNDP